ncbi:class I SAM-dependent methyltransferase [Saccharothrix hoggarensis]|uniref:Class I SAM-dependent methyltransferase n=1 Tax=Saccharothrix hoggarensis TaxID=913853 RepID=A0ABW3QSR3_9PSEU
MSTWLDEWNRAQGTYVNDRHRERHFRSIADDVIRLLPAKTSRVLDYGPGDALFADDIAAACAGVILCEAADSIRDRLVTRFAASPGVSVIGPDGLAGLPSGSIGLVVAHSVVQYLSPEELAAFLREARRLLGDDGVLVIGDIIPRRVGLVTDTAELLRFAARDGFVLAALRALARNAASPYARVRKRLGLTRLDEHEVVELAREAGLTGSRQARNLGNNNRSRWTFIARPDTWSGEAS